MKLCKNWWMSVLVRGKFQLRSSAKPCSIETRENGKHEDRRRQGRGVRWSVGEDSREEEGPEVCSPVVERTLPLLARTANTKLNNIQSNAQTELRWLNTRYVTHMTSRARRSVWRHRMREPIESGTQRPVYVSNVTNLMSPATASLVTVKFKSLANYSELLWFTTGTPIVFQLT